MENKELRDRAKREGVHLWQIALEIGCCDMTLSRWLRVPLSPDKEKRINSAIDAIIEKRGVTA